MFYAAFNSISVISWRQFTLFMSFLGFTSTVLGWGSEVSCPRTHPRKKPRGSSAARTQDPWITSQRLYHSEILWLFDSRITALWQTISIHVSLRELRRLTSVDTFCRCNMPPPLLISNSIPYLSCTSLSQTIRQTEGKLVQNA